LPFSEEFKDLALKLVQYHHYNRPNLREIKEHPWLQGKTASAAQVKEGMQ
jgi:hypothetical protein